MTQLEDHLNGLIMIQSEGLIMIQLEDPIKRYS